MSREIQFEDFYRIPIKVFKIVGFYLISEQEPDNSKAAKLRSVLLRCYQVFEIINYILLVALLAAQAYVFRDNPKSVMEKLPDTMNLTAIAIKFYILYSNREKIEKSLLTMKEMFITSKSEQEQYGIESYYKEAKFLVRLFGGLNFLVYLNVISDMLKTVLTHGTNQFMTNLWLPYDYENIFVYSLSTAWIVYDYFYTIIVYSTEISFFIVIVLLAMNFDILSEMLKKTFSDVATDKVQLKALLQRHYKLIDICNLMEKIFSPCLFINFVQSSFLLCIRGFDIVLGSSDGRTLAYMLFVMHLIQIFIFCQYGQKLIDSSLKVCDAVYESEWNCIKDNEIKLMVVQIMVYTQRPKKLTANGFKVISRETFTAILLSAYSYFTLLQQLYGVSGSIKG